MVKVFCVFVHVGVFVVLVVMFVWGGRNENHEQPRASFVMHNLAICHLTLSSSYQMGFKNKIGIGFRRCHTHTVQSRICSRD
jgi:hypothetical protein